jgi:twinkle protein
MSDMTTGGTHRFLPKRALTEETCKLFDYRADVEYGGEKVQVANYRKDGTIVAQKVRTKSKDFAVLGDSKSISKMLFGAHLWRDGGKRVVITEGEIDAMSVSQAQGNKWPVVSIPNGAQGATKTIAHNLEWLNKFETVIFCFDMDEPGQEAAKECAAMLEPGRAHIAHLPLKDANEMLVAGKAKELIDAMWNARAYRPDGVVDVATIAAMAAKEVEVGRAWPWATLTEKTYGRRRKELYGFGGGTGCGKSTVFKQVALHIIENEKLPVGMIMLEEPPAHTLRTLAGMKMGKRVHVPGVTYKQDDLRATIDTLNGKVFFYDHFGAMGWDAIKEKMRFMVLALGCKDIFLDHLTALAASIDEDERKAIDKIMAELSALTQELDCTIYFVSHLTTPEGKPHEEGGRVLEKQFRGSRSIGYWSHFLFGIERDKQKTDGVTTFRVLKDRYTGDSAGTRFGLAYSRETGLLDECALGDDNDNPMAHGGKPKPFKDGGEF